jgi:X-X-X-Leu-X-X-Gly heptad repeat protein
MISLTIKRKLLLGFALIIVASVVLSLVSYSTINTMGNVDLPIVEANAKIEEDMLTMRKEEKNFLMEETINPEFFETGESEYLDKFEVAHQDILVQIEKVAAWETTAEGDQRLAEMKNDVVEYYNEFMLVVAKIEERGFKSYGLEGELRDASIAIEDELKLHTDVDDLMILLLTCRRYEKDYLLRGETQYVTELTEAIEEFKTTLEASNLDAATKSEMTKLINEYKTEFDAVYAIDVEIGLTVDDGLTGQYRETINKLEPLVVAQSEELNAVVSNSVQTSIITIVALSAAAAGFGVALAYIIPRGISKPLGELIEDANVIAEGDLGYEMKVKDRKDEIGEVITAIKTMVKNTAEPIVELQRVASNIANGDLTQNVSVQAKGDLQKLIDSFTEMTGSLKGLIGKVLTATETVTSMSQEVGSTAQEVNAGMEQISSATQQISDGAQKLAKLGQETANHVNNLSQLLEQTGERTGKSVQYGSESMETMEQIQSDSEKAIAAIEQIRSSMQNTTQSVEGMDESLIKIGELANMVTDVASQTEMLALNAAIEAARAGEAGRGFAVVADAVKGLSEQSSQAANETLQSVSGVQTKGKETLDVAKKANVQANDGVEVVKTSIEGTKNVAGSIKKINDMLQQVSTGVGEGLDSIKAVVNAIDEVSTISQESASASEENSAAVEEQTASMNQLATNAAKLSEVAMQLKQEVEKFKL